VPLTRAAPGCAEGGCNTQCWLRLGGAVVLSCLGGGCLWVCEPAATAIACSNSIASERIAALLKDWHALKPPCLSCGPVR
jgi:hypothetical protein